MAGFRCTAAHGWWLNGTDVLVLTLLRFYRQVDTANTTKWRILIKLTRNSATCTRCPNSSTFSTYGNAVFNPSSGNIDRFPRSFTPYKSIIIADYSTLKYFNFNLFYFFISILIFFNLTAVSHLIQPLYWPMEVIYRVYFTTVISRYQHIDSNGKQLRSRLTTTLTGAE